MRLVSLYYAAAFILSLTGSPGLAVAVLVLGVVTYVTRDRSN